MIFLISDIHANEKTYKKRMSDIERRYGRYPDERDLVVCLGDLLSAAGGQRKDKKRSKITVNKRFLRFLLNEPYQIISVMGNHDDLRMLRRIGYVCDREFNNDVLRLSANVSYMEDGKIYELEDPESGKKRSVLALGGGFGHMYRFRKAPRIFVDGLWRRYEFLWMRSDSYDNKRDLLASAKNYIREKEGDEAGYIREWVIPDKLRVDYVLSHDAPASKMGRIVRAAFGITPMNMILDLARKHIIFKHWYFGHHHFDYEPGEKFTCIYRKSRRLK